MKKQIGYVAGAPDPGQYQIILETDHLPAEQSEKNPEYTRDPAE
jgi:hypothetical protein